MSLHENNVTRVGRSNGELLRVGDSIQIPEMSQEFIDTVTLEIKKISEWNQPSQLISLKNLSQMPEGVNAIENLKKIAAAYYGQVVQISNDSETCKIRLDFGDSIIFFDNVHTELITKVGSVLIPKDENKPLTAYNGVEIKPGMSVKIIDPSENSAFIHFEDNTGELADRYDDNMDLEDAVRTNSTLRVLRTDTHGNVFLVRKIKPAGNFFSMRTKGHNVEVENKYKK